MQNVFSSKELLIDSLGSFIVDCSAKAIQDHKRFTVAFSGGSAATSVCSSLNLPKFSKAVDWSKWYIFFCDERFVDLNNPDSNYKAIHDGLLTKFPKIKENNVYKLKKVGSVSDAASAYEKELRGVFQDENLPRFDLLILGMGPDGHICSLFPNHALLKERKKWIASLEDSPKPPPERITFTVDVVNNAKDIIFYTTGESKAENIRNAIEGESTEDVPASLVKPVHGNVHWFMDTAAARLLNA